MDRRVSASDHRRTPGSAMEGSAGGRTEKKVVAVVGGGLVRKENERELLIHCAFPLLNFALFTSSIATDTYKEFSCTLQCLGGEGKTFLLLLVLFELYVNLKTKLNCAEVCLNMAMQPVQ